MRRWTPEIARGQTVGLLGRNGMVKSTLIRRLFGKDASRYQPHEVARLGVAYVPEGRGVFPNLSARSSLPASSRCCPSAGH